MTSRYARQRWNVWAFGLDFITFSLALNFLSPHIVLPSFAARLGASSAIVGLLTTTFFLFLDIPQIIAGNVVARRARKKPTVLWMAGTGRPLIGFFTLALWLTGSEPAWLVLALLFVALIGFCLTDAFAAIAWFDMLGRAFPPEKRGGYLAIWQVLKGIAVLGIAALVGFVLSEAGPPFPYNYALLFVGGTVALAISCIGLAMIREPPLEEDEPAETHIAWRDFGSHLVSLWRQDDRLRRVTLARLLLALSTMASAFYVLYATQELGFPEQVIAGFISAQTIGGLVSTLILGRISDRFGASRVIHFGVIIVITAPIYALALSLSGPGLAAVLKIGYVWVYICIGLIENVIILGFLNYLLDMTPPGQRTIYMGVSNAVAGLGVLGPTLAGWLLGVTSYQVLFTVAAALGVGALVLALRLPHVQPESVSSM